MRIRHFKQAFWDELDRIADRDIFEGIYVARKAMHMAPYPFVNTPEFTYWLTKYKHRILDVFKTEDFEERVNKFNPYYYEPRRNEDD